jgi:uncharacterized protein
MHKPLRFWWHELNTWQPEEALAFYGRTLGWTFEPMQLPDGHAYWTARKAGLPVGGIMALDEAHHAGIPSHWMTYMAVDAMDSAIEATLKAGGSLERPAVAVPGVGVLAVVADPAGALVGLMQPDRAHSEYLGRPGAWAAPGSTAGRDEEIRPTAPRAQAG